MRHFDLVVIGSGPGGQKAAVQAAKLGRSVAVAERCVDLGGVCINSGTIPSKTLREAILDLSGLRQRSLYGESYRGKTDISVRDLMMRTSLVMRRERDVVRNQLLRNQVTVVPGLARFEGPQLVAVDSGGETVHLEAEKIVIAVGTVPGMPAGLVVDHKTVLTSDDVLALPELPRLLTIIGAGIIGIEYATMFAALGIEVVLVDKRTTVLDMVDREIAEALLYHARNRNVTLRLGEEVDRLERPDGATVVLVTKSGKRLASEMVLVSAGRVGATAGLGLERAGLTADGRGRITVDAHYRTAVAHIYAVGDVIGNPSLASTSMEQGRVAACHAFGVDTRSVPALFPFGIYAIPEIGWVGQREDELTAQGVPFETGVARYDEIARGHILGDIDGMLKLIFHLDTRRILGVWALGTQATELVHIGQAVMSLEGRLDYFISNVFNYPTLAECYKVAALDGLNKLRKLGMRVAVEPVARNPA